MGKCLLRHLSRLPLRGRLITVLTLPTPGPASLTSTPLRRQLPSQPACKFALPLARRLPAAASPPVSKQQQHRCSYTQSPEPNSSSQLPSVNVDSRAAQGTSIHRRRMGGELHVTIPASADGAARESDVAACSPAHPNTTPSDAQAPITLAVPLPTTRPVAVHQLLQSCRTRLTIMTSATARRADAPAHHAVRDAHTLLAAALAAETTIDAVNAVRDPPQAVHKAQGVISHTEQDVAQHRVPWRTRTT